MLKKIYYHDTDAGGVVYYANYLKYFEEARTEYLKEKGIDILELSKKGILLVVRKVDIDYKSPARYADNLTIASDISKLKNVSIEFSQQALKNEKVLVSAKTQLVCINDTFSPRPFPVEIANQLAA